MGSGTLGLPLGVWISLDLLWGVGGRSHGPSGMSPSLTCCHLPAVLLRVGETAPLLSETKVKQTTPPPASVTLPVQLQGFQVHDSLFLTVTLRQTVSTSILQKGKLQQRDNEPPVKAV